MSTNDFAKVMSEHGALAKVAGEFTSQSSAEQRVNRELFDLAAMLLPHYGNQWNAHSVVTMKRQTLSRILYYQQLYLKILEIPGVICEFGVQWGATLAQLINLRGMYEPYNHTRTIFGFDTYQGFSTIDEKDAGFSAVGDYATLKNYQETLEKVLLLQESFSPLAHIKKFSLIRGDASKTIDGWLEQHQESVISMAIFDMDVYKPTRDVLEKVLPRLTKGSLLVFDELNNPHFPGETLAVNEVLGLNKLALRRFPHQPYCAWAVFGE